jgi:PfaB family protein
LNKAKLWGTKDDLPKRAAISGFGFGGINAHVLLQEYKKEAKQESSTINIEYDDIAIVGIDSRLGPWNDQYDLDKALLFGEAKKTNQPENWWGSDSNNYEGYFINEVNVPLGRYRIPPAELKEMLPQQLLMLEVAANALEDASLSELSKEQQCRTGVFVGIELDLNTTNFHFRWMQKKYACEWLQHLGIQLNDNDLNEWVENLKQVFGPALTANRTMGALGGIVASRIARAFRIGGPSFTISSEETSGLRALESGVHALQQKELDQVIVGAVDLASDIRVVKTNIKQLDNIADAATAFVLKRHEDAVRDGDKVYALIKGIGVASAGGCDDKVDNSAVISAIQNACSEANCHLDDIDFVSYASNDDVVDIPALKKSVNHSFSLGDSGAANGLINLAGSVSALHHCVLPSVRDSRYWLKDKVEGSRKALVNSTSIGGNCVSVVLEQADVDASVKSIEQKVISISTNSKESLINKIKNISFEQNIEDSKEKYRAVLLVKSEKEFKQCCEELITAINNNASIDNGCCFYSAEPVAIKGKVAFVYPGSGNHFYGMGQELGVSFPNVLEKLNRENNKLASQFANGRFWKDQDDENNHGNALSHEEVIFGQVWLGTFVSDVISSFNIKPDAVIGYSLGETAGFFSTRTWKARDEMLNRIQQSTLFTEELAGVCTSVQKAWGTDDSIDWALGVVNASAKKVKTVLEQYERVYLLIINTPNECVLGGDKAELYKAVKELAVHFHPLTGVTTVHCEVAKPVEKAYRDLHIFETTPPKDVTFYSGIRGGAYEVTQDSAADSVLDQALAPFDYTKVINNAYQDGVRLFVEMGPGNSCARMIGQILEGKQHYAKAICVKGQNSIDNTLQTIARLYVEGVDVDFSVLGLELENISNKKEYENYITVKTGGKPFKVPLPPVQKTEVAEQKQVEIKETVSKENKANEVAMPLPMAANGNFQPVIEQMQ